MFVLHQHIIINLHILPKKWSTRICIAQKKNIDRFTLEHTFLWQRRIKMKFPTKNDAVSCIYTNWCTNTYTAMHKGIYVWYTFYLFVTCFSYRRRLGDKHKIDGRVSVYLLHLRVYRHLQILNCYVWHLSVIYVWSVWHLKGPHWKFYVFDVVTKKKNKSNNFFRLFKNLRAHNAWRRYYLNIYFGNF